MFTIREPHGRSLKYRQMVLMVQMVRYGYPLLNHDYHPKDMCRERSVKVYGTHMQTRSVYNFNTYYLHTAMRRWVQLDFGKSTRVVVTICQLHDK